MTLNAGAVQDMRRLAQLQNMPCQFDFTISSKTDGDPSPLALQLARGQMVALLSESPLAEIYSGPYDGPAPDPCSAGKRYCAIGPTGDVMPCIMMPSVMGNVRQRSFRQIWQESPLFHRLRALTVEDLHTCQSCDVKGACGRCPGLAMRRGQDIDGCDLAAKEVAKAKVAAWRLRVIQ
jgi:radical SAM protein with 4Fe4S-binding SPASM domain